MQENKNKIISIAATGIFHLAILLFLAFYYLQPSIDKRFSEDLEGVPVMFGNVPDALGNDEPFGRGDGTTNIDETLPPPNAEEVDNTTTEATTKEVVAPKTVEKADIRTQDFEKTAAIKAKAEADKRAEAEAAERRKKQAEADRIAREEAEKKNQINNQMAGLFGNGSGSGSRGNTEGTGTQGVETGNASYGKTSGIGGWGTYDLGGRSVGHGGLVQPSYSVNDYGTVVVDIIVNPNGDVLEATIGRGTNTPSTSLRNESLKAARRTKFNKVSTAGNQKGKITYKFNLN